MISCVRTLFGFKPFRSEYAITTLPTTTKATLKEKKKQEAHIILIRNQSPAMDLFLIRNQSPAMNNSKNDNNDTDGAENSPPRILVSKE